MGAGINRGAIVVPDGVASVRLTAFRLLSQPTADTRGITSTNSPVHANVTLFELGYLTMSSLHLDPAQLGRFFSQGSGRGCKLSYAVYALPASAQMIWLRHDGSVIRDQTIEFPLYVSTHHPAPGTTTRNPTCTR